MEKLQIKAKKARKAKRPLPVRSISDKYEIDATGRAVGRIATEVAMILRGKNKPDFTPHIDSGNFVTVNNASQVKFTGKKLVQKDYHHHTMYPGGLKTKSMKKVFDENPTEVIKRAVYGMLPKNRLRSEMMKRLTISA
ncbi:MAG: 50S ribosomal protein L13 [bacterium]|nr:50S ribosomal protein L13 [bacterium]